MSWIAIVGSRLAVATNFWRGDDSAHASLPAHRTTDVAQPSGLCFSAIILALQPHLELHGRSESALPAQPHVETFVALAAIVANGATSLAKS